MVMVARPSRVDHPIITTPPRRMPRDCRHNLKPRGYEGGTIEDSRTTTVLS